VFGDDLSTTLIHTTSSSRSQADVNQAWLAVETYLRQLLADLDKVRGTSVEREWRPRIEQSLSNVSVHRQTLLDLVPGQRGAAFRNAQEMVTLLHEWNQRIRKSIGSGALSVPGSATSGSPYGFQQPEPPPAWYVTGPKAAAEPSYWDQLITGSAGAGASYTAVSSQQPQSSGWDDLFSLATGPGASYTMQVQGSNDPAGEIFKPAPDRESTWLTGDQIAAMIATMFKGYSGVKKAELQARTMAIQAQGTPIQAPKSVIREVKSKTMNWGLLGLGLLGVLGVGVLIYSVAKPGRATPRMLPAATMKLLPAPA